MGPALHMKVAVTSVICDDAVVSEVVMVCNQCSVMLLFQKL